MFSFFHLLFLQEDYFRKSDISGCQSGEEMTLNAFAECGIARDNSIVFSAIVNEVAAADQAYQRFNFN